MAVFSCSSQVSYIAWYMIPAYHGQLQNMHRATMACRSTSRWHLHERHHAATYLECLDCAKSVTHIADWCMIPVCWTCGRLLLDGRLSFTMTPRTLKLLMSRHADGSWADLLRLPHAATIISFNLPQLSFRLFSATHFWIWVISRSRELELEAGTTKYVSSANLTICEHTKTLRLFFSLKQGNRLW